MKKPILHLNKPLLHQMPLSVVFVALGCILWPSVVWGLEIIPGLKGFGTDTRAAYGLAPGTNPTVYKVTNLNTSGSGSLKECIDATGPRVCVFEISGTIEAEGYLRIKKPYITIAGQTAPSPGIMLKGTTLVISTHDVLVQHIRVRPGDEGGVEGENRDGIGIATQDGEAYNIVVDHCSVSWGIDENIQFWYAGLHDITVSNCIISEGLDDSLHPHASHSKGLLVGRDEDNLSIINNLFAHNYARNPVLYNSKTAVINNLIYNSGDFAINAAGSPGPVVASVVGNVIIKGKNSGKYVDYALSISNHIWKPWFDDGVGSKIYVLDNDCVKCTSDPWTGVDDRGGLKDIVKVDSPPLWPPDLVAKPGLQVKDYVLNNAGARPADRDSVDIRIINDVLAGTGRIIDCVTPEPNYWPTAFAAGGTSNTIILATSDSDYDDRFNGKKIEILDGKGSGQSKIINDYVGITRVATINTPWNIIPDDSTSKYRIEIDCSKNAGGWPVLAENHRTLTLPANLHSDSGDGYTNLEKWIHAFSCDVEGPDAPSCLSAIFSTIPYLGDSLNWEPLNQTRWSVVFDNGGLRYGIITTDYSSLSGSRLGEYSLIKDRTYSDFTFTAKVKSSEDLRSNSGADYNIVFGYQDENNYYYMMFNSNPANSQLFKVISGQREWIADSTELAISDNAYHDLKLERKGNNIKVYFDNILKLEATDSTFSSGKIGIGGLNDASLWDDIVIDGTPALPGDLNDDNQVNILDIQACINVILGVETDPEIIRKAKEVTEPHGECNVLDIQAIVGIILKI